jgi:hypothetical protein
VRGVRVNLHPKFFMSRFFNRIHQLFGGVKV